MLMKIASPLRIGLYAYIVALPVQLTQQVLNMLTMICLDLHWDAEECTSSQPVIAVLWSDPMHTVNEDGYGD